MPGWKVEDFGGTIPRRDPRLLPPTMAEVAVNCDLQSGPLDGLPQPQAIIDLSNTTPWPVRRAYRMPGPAAGQADVWLPLPSEFSSVVPSPMANDTSARIYWTNPQGQPEAGAWWNTYARLAAGGTSQGAGPTIRPFNMGFIAPNPGITLVATPSGGSDPATLPYITRSYVITYVDAYGSESAPSSPSAPVDGASDGTWTITGLPTSPDTNPPGMNYPPVQTMRLYRTITGTTTGAQFYYVTDLPWGAASYVDTIPDTTVVNNNQLLTASYAPPLANIDGLTAFPGGMLVAFTGNTVHFCDPNLPHTWPAGYDVSVHFPIQGFAVWQQQLVVLTKGFPSSGAGTTPDQFVFNQVQVPEPCIARGSIITDLAGVYYASQNGLVMLNYFGMQNQTLSNMTKNIWLEDFQAEAIIACRHRAQYLAINGTDTGFIIDYSEQRMGVVTISPFVNVISVWNDAYNGTTYMVADNVVYEWDSPTTPPLTYRWRSKQFYLPHPGSMGACQISLDPAVAEPIPIPSAPPPHTGDPSIHLPPGVNAVFNLFVGPDGKNQVMSKRLTQPREIFRLPSGLKAFNWQFEIISRVPVHLVKIASTMKELAKIQ